MKKLITVIAITITTLIAFKAAAIVGAQGGPVDVKLTVLTQEGYVSDPASSKTNTTAISTNITVTGKSTITKTKLGGSDLLSLMANSFNTNFPSGSQVGIILGGTLGVFDSTGTNIIFTPPFTAVYLSNSFSPVVQSASQVVTTTIDTSGTTTTGYGNAVNISVATLVYDDTAFTTADGTHTQFTFTGEYTQNNTRAKGKDFIVISGQFDGAANATLRDQSAVITGTFRIKPFRAEPAGL